MDRLTKKDKLELIDGVGLQEVVERLAKFENMYDEIANSRQTISAQLELLRQEGKCKTVQFKELIVKKLNLVNFVNEFEKNGLK